MADNKLPSGDNARVASLLGLARKAGRIVAGTPLICDALRHSPSGKSNISLVVMSALASDNSKKRLSDKCAFYGCKLLTVTLSPAELAHAVGKDGAVAGVSISDHGLAALILDAAGDNITD